MKNAPITLTAAIALGTLVAGTAIAPAYPGQRLAPQASVSISRARVMATRVVPGTIVSEELEKETGGSGLRYSFDVKGAHGVREVGIDAKTGRVLENSADTPSAASGASEGPEGSGD